MEAMEEEKTESRMDPICFFEEFETLEKFHQSPAKNIEKGASLSINKEERGLEKTKETSRNEKDEVEFGASGNKGSSQRNFSEMGNSPSSGNKKRNMKGVYIDKIKKLTSDEKLREHLDKWEEKTTITRSISSVSTVPSILCKRRGNSGDLSQNEETPEMRKVKSRDYSKAARQRKKVYRELLEKKLEQLTTANKILKNKLELRSCQQTPLEKIVLETLNCFHLFLLL